MPQRAALLLLLLSACMAEPAHELCLRLAHRFDSIYHYRRQYVSWRVLIHGDESLGGDALDYYDYEYDKDYRARRIEDNQLATITMAVFCQQCHLHNFTDPTCDLTLCQNRESHKAYWPAIHC